MTVKKTAGKKTLAKKSTGKPAKKIVRGTVKPVSKTPVKKAGKKSAKKAAQKVVKNAVKAVTKKAAKAAVKKATGAVLKKAGKKAAKTAVKAAVKAAVKKSAKKSALKPTAKAAPRAAVSKSLKGTKTSKPFIHAPKGMAGEHSQFKIAEADAGARIDRFLGDKLENASRTRIQKWMESGAILINGEPARKSRILDPGDVVLLDVPEELPMGRAEPENIPLEIVYEDKYLVVVNKPKGLVTHPGHGVPGGTLANALAYRYKTLSDFGGSDRPGIVHRLDKDTSGLLVAARDNTTHAALSTMLAARHIHRTYQALTWREPSPEGTFDLPLGRHSKDPVRRAVVAPSHRGVPGKSAVTHYRVLNWYQFAAHVEVTLETGRTHQIRVHFSHAGFPIAGDTIYGGGEPMLGRVPPLFQSPAAALLKRLSSQALHAVKLSFVHPRTKKKLTFESPLPEEFTNALKLLEKFKREDHE